MNNQIKKEIEKMLYKDGMSKTVPQIRDQLLSIIQTHYIPINDYQEILKAKNDKWRERIEKYYIPKSEAVKIIEGTKKEFIKEFCNDHNEKIRWLRGLALDEEDLLEQILEFLSAQKEKATKGIKNL